MGRQLQNQQSTAMHFLEGETCATALSLKSTQKYEALVLFENAGSKERRNTTR